MVRSLVNLNGLSAHLRLPTRWLRQEARAGRLPCLRVGRKLLFDLGAVERALAERAATGWEQSHAKSATDQCPEGHPRQEAFED
jgi:hypothetical protein